MEAFRKLASLDGQRIKPVCVGQGESPCREFDDGKNSERSGETLGWKAPADLLDAAVLGHKQDVNRKMHEACVDGAARRHDERGPGGERWTPEKPFPPGP